MGLKMTKQLAPIRVGVNGYGNGNKKQFLTIHQTGNTKKGANAQMHANLQSGVYGASWHYQVDDKEAIQSFEHGYSCWHSSDGRGNGNLNSIAIEGCINEDGNYVQSIKNMAELAAIILKQEGIPISNMKQHNDWDIKNRKNCPAQIRAGKDGINWTKFVQMVQDNLNKLNGKPVSKPVVVAPKPTPAPVKSKYNLPSGVYRYRANEAMRHGNDVLQIQLALSSLYFYPNKGAKNNGCDSWYGKDTANAVKRFQSMHGLSADGDYGEKTRVKLQSLTK